MRTPGFALCIALVSGSAGADDLSTFAMNDFVRAEDPAAEFRLGGAARRSETRRALPPSDTPTLRLAIPSIVRETGTTERDTPFGGLALTFGESWNGREVIHVGTSLTRGATTAGVAVTYEDADGDLTSGKLYIDYAFSDRVSVGVSGILTDEVMLDDAPVPMLGINAELTGRHGGFVQGGVSDAGQADPIFGIAVGLRF